MFLLWIALFTMWHGEAEISLERAISDAIMTASVVPLETQDSEPPRNLDEF
jgi:hypothetical protein